MKKGISPIIAATLLIAFTMSVALLTGPFLTNLTTNAQEGQNEEAKNLVDAASTSFEIDDVAYDTGSGNYTVVLRNTGSNSISNFSASVYGGTPVQKSFSENLAPGEITRFEIQTDTNEEYTRLQIDDSTRPVSTEYSLEDVKSGEAPTAPTGLSVSKS